MSKAEQAQSVSHLTKAYLEGFDHTQTTRPTITRATVQSHTAKIHEALQERYRDELELDNGEIEKLMILTYWAMSTGGSIGSVIFIDLLGRYDELNTQYQF